MIEWERHIPYKRMPEVYNRSDIFVLPSVTMTNNQEQFGMAALEAMACEIPTIVTDVGGLPYVADSNSTSFVVEERNSGELRSAMEKLVESPELREQFGQAGRQRAESKFDKRAIARTLDNFYEGL
jgi:glycosyltransferase involved in cell wall biosynthesis